MAGRLGNRFFGGRSSHHCERRVKTNTPRLGRLARIERQVENRRAEGRCLPCLRVGKPGRGPRGRDHRL